MNSNRILQYMNGYVDIVIEGYYIERFINICNTKNILLWNIKKENSIVLHASVEVKDFKSLKTICKKTKCKMKIEKKKGFPFLVRKYRKRKVFIGLLLCIIIFIFALSNFIWNIEVEGNTDISKEEILALASEEGLSIGKLKGQVDTKQVINKIRLERDDVAWAGIEIRGTNAIIQIVEADEKPDMVNEDEYCNIVADKDGMITKISAQNGTPLVKEGDVVTKGDIIVAGWMEGKYTGTRYVHAQGEIQAKVWYTSTQRVDLKETQKVETGNQETKYSVKLNNFQINLHKSVPNFEKYDTIETSKKLKLFSDFYLPIELIEYTYKEYEEVIVVHSYEEAKQIGIDKAAEDLKDELQDKEILDRQVNVKSEADYIEVEVIYEVEENIGIEQEMNEGDGAFVRNFEQEGHT